MISKRVFLTLALLLVVSATAMAATVDIKTYAAVNTLAFVNSSTLDLYDSGNTTGPVWAAVTTNVTVDGVAAASPIAGLTTAVTTAYNGGAWTGTVDAITNDTCLANAAADKYALAPLTGAEWTGLNGSTFHAMTVGAGWGLTQFTYSGDVDLSGSVNTTDLSIVKTNVLTVAHGGTLPANDWVNGDLDYSGTVNTTDLSIVKTAVISASHNAGAYPTLDFTQLPYVPSAGAAAAVPEPTTFVLGFLAFACFFGYRKFFN